MPEVAPVTIVMATRNGAAHLSAQLNSLVSQTVPWRLFVSDDGSWDDTRLVLARFSAAHPELETKVVEGPRARLSGANFLAALRHPELPAGPVAFCDQDDIWHPDRLALGLQALEACQGPGLSVSAVQPVSEDGGETLGPPLPFRPASMGNALVQNTLPGSAMTLNAQAVSALRADPAPPQPLPFHDWWIYLRAMAAGWHLCAVPHVTVQYRQHGGNVQGSRAGAWASVTRAKQLYNGRWTAWRDANLDALLALPEGAVSEEARRAAHVLRHGQPRWTAWKESGATRQSRLEQALFLGLAGLGRL